jgi:hypothetical protein
LYAMSNEKTFQSFFTHIHQKMIPTSYKPVASKDSNSSRSSNGEEYSEEESFIPRDQLIVPPRRSVWQNPLRLLIEVALLLGSLTALGVTLKFQAKSLHGRQQECGRLLGQWRKLQSWELEGCNHR